MRKLIGAGVAVILAATLAGCASPRTSTEREVDSSENIEIVTKVLSDGVILECAYSRTYGGFDCNWEGVTVEREKRLSE